MVFKRCAGQAQLVVCFQYGSDLSRFRADILDVLGLIENQQVKFMFQENFFIPWQQGIRRQDDIGVFDLGKILRSLFSL